MKRFILAVALGLVAVGLYLHEPPFAQPEPKFRLLPCEGNCREGE